MKNNKLISILLALLVCLSMVVSVSATENELTFTLESDSSVEILDAAVVNAGETFTVSVNVANNPGFIFVLAGVEYNVKELELVSVKAVMNDVPVVLANSNIEGFQSIQIGKLTLPVTGDAITAEGAVAEMTFKALVETDTKSAITLKVDKKNVVSANGRSSELEVAGDVMNVNIVAADHKCDETKTIEANNAVEPTCTEAGKATDTLCAHCGKLLTEGEEIAATGHSFGEYVVTTAPTCNAFGVQTRTCSACGETETDENVPKVEHTFGEWKVTTEATTEAEGVETRTCSGCGQAETRPIAKLAPVEQPEPKNNTLLIVIIVVVVLAGAGVAAFFVLKNKKK